MTTNELTDRFVVLLMCVTPLRLNLIRATNMDDDKNQTHPDPLDMNPELEPILFQKLVPGDYGFNRGYRFQIVRVDNDVKQFRDQRQATEFIAREGMMPISDDEMEEIRRELYFPE